MTLLITALNPVAEGRSRYPVPHLNVDMGLRGKSREGPGLGGGTGLFFLTV